MTGAEVRKMTTEEIDLEVKRLRMETFKLRTAAVTEKIEDTSKAKKTRRDIARLLTERTVRLKGTTTPAAAKRTSTKGATAKSSTAASGGKAKATK